LYFTGVFISAYDKKDGVPVWRISLAAVMIFSAGLVYMSWAVKHNKAEFNKNKYELTQKTEGKLLNGHIIKSDTIYVLTRKK
jgi:hypothetical protein